jgi:hypothetical protein
MRHCGFAILDRERSCKVAKAGQQVSQKYSIWWCWSVQNETVLVNNFDEGFPLLVWTETIAEREGGKFLMVHILKMILPAMRKMKGLKASCAIYSS